MTRTVVTRSMAFWLTLFLCLGLFSCGNKPLSLALPDSEPAALETD